MPPPQSASGRVGGAAATSRLGSDPAVDLSGRVRLAEVDRRGWTVVAEDDFASPDLARLARSGERAIPTSGDQTGVVMTGPLATRSPTVASPRGEIDRIFRGVETRAPADVSPLLARSSTMDPAVARQLAQPTTLGEIARRSTAAATSSRQTVSPRLSATAGSPFSEPSGSRLAQPNLYRPTTRNTSPSGSTLAPSGSSAGGRQLVAPRSGSAPVTGSRPMVVPPSGSGRSTVGTRSTGSSRSVGKSPSRSPSRRAPVAGSSRSPSGSSRSTAGRTRSSSGSSRSPSVGSRSSGSRSRPSAGSSRPSTRSSSSKSSGAKKR